MEVPMKRRLLALLLLALPCAAPAHVFEDGFESPRIEPLFPVVGGRYQLPPGAVATQLDWLLSELASGAVTTEAEVNAHFTAGWLAGNNAAATVAFINSIRATYPDAYIADLVAATPTRVTATLRSPANASVGYFSFGTRYADTQRINTLGVSGFNGNSVIFPVDQNLTLAQAADKFASISSAPGLLVARVDGAGQCQPIVSRNPDTLRATASVFKTWVLGGAAVAVRDGQLSPGSSIPLTASDRAPPTSEGIALEANGTAVSAIDMARLMIGNSDNTATDHLHERVGRPIIDAWVSASGVANPDVLRPLLKINEQFHVFRTLPRPDADAYVTGDEAYQYSVVPQLEAFGTTLGGFFHSDLLVTGTWRASPRDVCQNLAQLRTFQGEALRLVDAAMGASAAQPNVRGRWDRVWYKGGSLAQAANQFNVYTHAWLLERNDEAPLVLIALSNSPTGGISGTNNPAALNDVFDIQSVTGRLLQLLAEL
jgi:beta-lactamase class A